jgi:hypothetical protein
MQNWEDNKNTTAIGGISTTAEGSFTPAPIDRVVLPLPPQNTQDAKFEMDLYARFMRNLRSVPNSQMDIKILSSIKFTADMMDVNDALVAKILVDLGLKAPRKAFPASFLEFADTRIARTGYENGGLSNALATLRTYWDEIGEERFAHVMAGRYAVSAYEKYVDA